MPVVVVVCVLPTFVVMARGAWHGLDSPEARDDAVFGSVHVQSHLSHWPATVRRSHTTGVTKNVQTRQTPWLPEKKGFFDGIPKVICIVNDSCHAHREGSRLLGGTRWRKFDDLGIRGAHWVGVAS